LIKLHKSAYKSADDDVKLFVEPFVVILDHTVVRDHTGTRNAFVDEFGGSFGLKIGKYINFAFQFSNNQFSKKSTHSIDSKSYRGVKLLNLNQS
jgi:hypothetical protein